MAAAFVFLECSIEEKRGKRGFNGLKTDANLDNIRDTSYYRKIMEKDRRVKAIIDL